MTQSRLVQALAVVLFSATGISAQEVQFTQRSLERIEGSLPENGVEFSSVLKLPALAVVEVRLPTGTLVRAEIDYVSGDVLVQSLAGESDELVPLDSDDPSLLAALLDAVGDPLSPREETLARMLAFVTAYPSGAVIDVNSASVKQGPREKVVSSLCATTGSQRSGTFDVGTKTYRQTAKLGPCYNRQNQCMGRCGPGCNAPPNPTFQVFTQDCLNHDLCTLKTGTIFGECARRMARCRRRFPEGAGLRRSRWYLEGQLQLRLEAGPGAHYHRYRSGSR